jgi:DNA-directed RNA polymerase specialized sigma24 family protein
VEVPPAWADLGVEDVRNALRSLPRRLGEPFELHVFRRLSYRQIAGRLRMPIATVGTRIFRARRTMRALLVARKVN